MKDPRRNPPNHIQNHRHPITSHQRPFPNDTILPNSFKDPHKITKIQSNISKMLSQIIKIRPNIKTSYPESQESCPAITETRTQIHNTRSKIKQPLPNALIKTQDGPESKHPTQTHKKSSPKIKSLRSELT